MNRKAKDAQKLGSSSNHTTDVIGDKPSWMKLQSVTQEGDLAEFLNTAQLADTDFTAERRNVTVISAPGLAQNKRHNPYLLSGEEEQEIKKKHKQNRQRLRVPRRCVQTASVVRSISTWTDHDWYIVDRGGAHQTQKNSSTEAKRTLS
jgi:large subunit GTPase 1